MFEMMNSHYLTSIKNTICIILGDQEITSFLYKINNPKLRKKSNQILNQNQQDKNLSQTLKKKTKRTANFNKLFPNTIGRYQNYINNLKDPPRKN